MKSEKIKLDKDLIERCRKYADNAGYSSVAEFISHVLEKELRPAREAPETDDEVAKQLKGLGYIE